ncbi:MAG: FAD-dependent oxidoreductase [Woeseiaceae bacterium]|nr:FAD-dependent oxidoreductase [Woeseiaceae bacterium]
MTRLYDDNLYRFNTPQPSYWEATAGNTHLPSGALRENESCDVAIVGGGYTGLSAALHLARDHDVDVRVLEAGHFGWGASGRNGGFCCLGGTALPGEELVRVYGADVARETYAAHRDAVELVRELLDEENIDAETQGDRELDVAHSARAFAGMEKAYELYSEVLGCDVELYSQDEFREQFYDSPEQFGGLTIAPTFGLHPLRYCRGLAAAAARHGAVLHDRSEVVDWSRDDAGYHRLATRGGELRARRVVYATNGFIDEGLRPEFQARTLPIISAIIVTRPLTGGERAAHNWVTEQPAANSRRILNYFRLLPDGRFLLGGRGYGTGRPDQEQRTYRGLRRRLAEAWPHWSAVDIDYSWQGLLCFTGGLRPCIGHLDDDESLWFGYGYHGNGVATGTWSGMKLARWIATGRRPELPGSFVGLGKRFPLPRLRLHYLRMGIALSRWLDSRG